MMAYRQLWLFVEGPDDTRFIRGIIRPLLEGTFDDIRIVEYSNLAREKIYKFLQSAKSTPYADYFFLQDINSSPCIAFKKKSIYNRYNKRVDNARTVVVIKEIESWYLAGLDERACIKLKVKHLLQTNTFTKEDFAKIIPRKFDSSNDFMIEILKFFSVDTAKLKNSSFCYFLNRLCPQKT
jgi:hypothetical protein